MKTVTSFRFTKEGYDPFIDFLKGVCILWVVITHAITPPIHDYSLFCLWGDMAVPLFLMIQCVHVYKKEQQPSPISCGKIWKRIIKPFLYVQSIILTLGIAKDVVQQRSPLDFVNQFLLSGGFGRGSYYPKMYLEFAILIPLFYPLFKRDSRMGGGVLLLISVVVEVLFCYIDFYPLWQWFCFRYLFLIYLGYMVATRGIKLNNKTVALSVLSVLFVLFSQYGDVNMEPLFYDNPWTIYHWPAYIFVVFLLIPFLYLIFQKVPKRVKQYTMLCGKYSYDIFLFQMLVFFVTDITIQSKVINYSFFITILFMLFVTMVSIVPIVWYREMVNKK